MWQLHTLIVTRSMQGASVSELYLLIKLLINIEDSYVDLCVITKKKKEIHMRTQEL